MADRKYPSVTANTVTDVEVGPAQVAGKNKKTIEAVEVTSVSGDDPIYFTVNGSAPEIRGDDTYVCQAGGSCKVTAKVTSPITVRLKTASTAVACVEGFGG